MNDFCPDCSTRLIEARDLRAHWVRLLTCPSCELVEFLEVGDAQWVYPLQRLERGIVPLLMEANDELIRTAVERIRSIDFKTVSIVDFEATLRGSYDPSQRYVITYPDGSRR
jgi:hypothetical protein